MTKASHDLLRRGGPLWITLTALLMGMNIILSSIRIDIGFAGIYLNNVVINIAAILLDPLAAFFVGGVGSFLGDFFFYPTPMFVSLAVHGLQAVAVSLISRHVLAERRTLSASLAMTVGSIITVIGYTIGRIYIYGDPSHSVAVQVALTKLLPEVAQAGAGAVIAFLLLYPAGLEKSFHRVLHGGKG